MRWMRGVCGAGGHAGMVAGQCLGMRAPSRLRISLPSRLPRRGWACQRPVESLCEGWESER